MNYQQVENNQQSKGHIRYASVGLNQATNIQPRNNQTRHRQNKSQRYSQGSGGADDIFSTKNPPSLKSKRSSRFIEKTSQKLRAQSSLFGSIQSQLSIVQNYEEHKKLLDKKKARQERIMQHNTILETPCTGGLAFKRTSILSSPASIRMSSNNTFLVKQQFEYTKADRYRLLFKNPAFFKTGCLSCGTDCAMVENYRERYCCNNCQKLL